MTVPTSLPRPAVPPIAEPRSLTADRPFLGIGLTALSMAVFSGMDGISKLLTAEFNPFQIAWTRFFFILLLLAPFLLRDGGRKLRSTRPLLQVARGFCMLASALLFITGLSLLPIADATSIGFVSPLFVTALSIPILGEQVGIRRWSAVLVGFLGVLLIVQPGSSAFNAAALLPVGSSACWALGLIFTRIMQSSDAVLTTLAWSTALGFLVLTPVALPLWEAPSAAGWAMLFGAAVLSAIGQLFLISAFRFAPASLIAPFSYSQIVWATLIGFFVFGTLPAPHTWAGAAVIVASGLYILHRERVVRSREKARNVAG
jgi:drug/metabolite transporter (DMT)-like permease